MINTYYIASSENKETSQLYKTIYVLVRKQGVCFISDNQPSESHIYPDNADFFITEITQSSPKVNKEIIRVLENDKPVLALLAAHHEDKLSPTLTANQSENLYLEYYTDESLTYIIRDFIKHIKTQKSRKGKLIVMDGGDGSGKTVQTNLLMKYLVEKKIPAKYVNFPQYYNSFHGKTVARFLRGEFGTIDHVSPYLASLTYALDRASIKNEMDDFLHKGGYIVANRYVGSNMAHQGCKIKDEKKREEYLVWEYDLEYKVNKIPKENIVLYLYVPYCIGAQLSLKKKGRKYLRNMTDIHENDVQHQIVVENMYHALCKRYKHWFKVDCIDLKNNLLSPSAIHQKIIKVLHQQKIL